MILNHLFESNPGHAGRPGQQGGSAPNGTPPPPPGANSAYNNLKSNQYEVPNDDIEYGVLSAEYQKIFEREKELSRKAFDKSITPDEKKDWIDIRSQKEDLRQKLGIYERTNRLDSLDTRLNQEWGSKKAVSQKSSGTVATKPRVSGGWKTPDAAKQYAEISGKARELSNKFYDMTRNLPKITVMTPEIKATLTSYLEIQQQLNAAVDQKEKFFQDNYVVGQ